MPAQNFLHARRLFRDLIVSNAKQARESQCDSAFFQNVLRHGVNRAYGEVLSASLKTLGFLMWDGWRPHSAVLGRPNNAEGYHDVARAIVR